MVARADSLCDIPFNGFGYALKVEMTTGVWQDAKD